MSAPSGTATVPTTKRERPDRPEAAARATKERSAKAGRPVAASEASRLGNTQIVLPARSERRSERYAARRKVRRLTRLDRVRACGRVPIGQQVSIRLSEGVAGVAGVETCGSVWACPVCAAKVAARRAGEVAALIDWAGQQGHSVLLLTLTMRHHAGQGLGQCWAALSKAWAAVTSGRGWIADRDQFGVLGWIRAVEVTHGQAGWHVHIHALLIVRREVDDLDASILGERMFSRWQQALRRNGFDAWSDHGGLDVRVVAMSSGDRVAGYLAKAMAWETVGGAGKAGRRASRTPFQILADIFEDFLAADADLWFEFERVSRGRRQMTWSRGLRDLAGLRSEVSDEEVAAEELGSAADDLIVLAGSAWAVVEPVVSGLLSAVEIGGIDAGNAWRGEQGLVRAGPQQWKVR